MVGLPGTISACLFDLDGVLTSTAALHRQAWKETFDELLRARDGADFAPFTERDYARYVDGLPRLDGVRRFLDARGIELPEGTEDDDVATVSVHGVGNRKNERVLNIIAEQGVSAFPGSVRYLDAVAAAGLAMGVVTSSANAEQVLEVAGLSRYLQARVDGLVIKRDRLRGKPAPDSFLVAADALGAVPSNVAVFEDALAGIEAAKAGGFGYVVGVNRADQAAELRAYGADIVVDDLAELLEVRS